MFEPFEQIGAAVEKRQGGTGLGLNICRRIADAMGGTMGLETQPGLGSTFWLEVELESAQAAPSTRSRKRRRWKPLSLSALSADAGAPLRILFADDSPSNQLLIRAMLQPTGHQIDIVFNGLEAVRALETLPYDLAFFDISMPEMDGREALSEVLSRQRRNRLARQFNRPDIPPLPIIALTANVMSGDREGYLADGFTAVISKPFEERELLEAILNYGPAPEDREPLAPLEAQADGAHGIDLIILDQLAERLGDGFTQTSVEIFTTEINQRLSALAAVSGSRHFICRSAAGARGAGSACDQRRGGVLWPLRPVCLSR